MPICNVKDGILPNQLKIIYHKLDSPMRIVTTCHNIPDKIPKSSQMKFSISYSKKYCHRHVKI